MRFKPETLGLLVRPRILASACIIPTNSITTNIPLKSLWDNPKRFEHLSLFKQSPSELFSELKLGDTSVNLLNAYTGQIVCFLTKIGNKLILVDKVNINQIVKEVKKKYGSRTNLRVISIGIVFYQGMKVVDGFLHSIKPWCPKTENNEEVVWFYKPWELVPTEEIVKYESVKKGDLILFPKCHGLVVKKKLLNKPKFYYTSSWSCYSITLLNHTADGFTRFLPDRKFTIRPAQEKHLLKDS
jgi:hypothetical protein